MKYQIRKVESVTSIRSSLVIELDPKKFKKLEINPYTGDSEEEFMTYMSEFDFEDPPYDLDDNTSKLLMDLSNSTWEEYANSCEKGSNVWLQIGEKDSAYYKTGGFKVNDEIESRY